MVTVHQAVMSGDGDGDCVSATPVRAEFSNRDFGLTTRVSGGAGVGQSGEPDPGHGGKVDEIDAPGGGVEVESLSGLHFAQDSLGLLFELLIVFEERDESNGERAVGSEHGGREVDGFVEHGSIVDDPIAELFDGVTGFQNAVPQGEGLGGSGLLASA